jgi:flagellar biosynthesis regulator FlaF
MSGYQHISRAYQSAVQLRPQREQDAEVFEIMATRLREAQPEGALAIIKAIAQNRTLWQTVYTLTLDDNNPQPVHVRKSMASLAKSVLAEMNKATPDIGSLIEINGNIASGLRGAQPSGGPTSGG